METLDCRVVREQLLSEIKDKIVDVDKKIEIAVISIGDDAVNDIYIKQKEKMFSSLGIGFRDIRLSSNVEELEILKVIDELNNDRSVFGIMIELPIIGDFDRDKIINRIDYRKDVDGLTKNNRDKLLKNKDCIISSTVEAILEIFKYYNVKLINKEIVIVGNGILVGKPLSIIFRNMDLDFVICDSKTEDIGDKIKNADIIVSCVGKKNVITSDMLNDGQFIIDVGVSVFEGISYGDVERSKIDDINGYITPVRGGVGAVTVVSLVKNLIKCYEVNSK